MGNATSTPEVTAVSTEVSNASNENFPGGNGKDPSGYGKRSGPNGKDPSGLTVNTGSNHNSSRSSVSGSDLYRQFMCLGSCGTPMNAVDNSTGSEETTGLITPSPKKGSKNRNIIIDTGSSIDLDGEKQVTPQQNNASTRHPTPPRQKKTSTKSKPSPPRIERKGSPLGTTNELHILAKSGHWFDLRNRLTSISNTDNSAHTLAGEMDEIGRTPLMLACKHGRAFPVDVARLLLVADTKAASTPVAHVSPNSTQKGEQYCLHVAVSNGCTIETLSVLHGAYPEAAGLPDGNGNMPLHLAVNNGKYRSVAGELDDENSDDDGTIHGSIASTVNSSYPVTQHSNGPAVNGNSQFAVDLSPGAMLMSETTLLSVCDMLITAYPQAMYHRNKRGETPLLLAIYRRAPAEVLSLIVGRGGTKLAKIPDDFGSYPIHFCDRSPNVLIVRDMVNFYPEAVRKRNKMGDTPLYFAVSDECPVETLEVLLEVCSAPRETVNNKNNKEMNTIAYSWENLHKCRLVAAEDQDEEDARVADNKDLVRLATRPEDIADTDVGLWWQRATLLLKAAYHDTIKMDDVGTIGRGDKKVVWRPVHAAAGTNCPPAVVRFVLQIHSQEAGNIDESWNTPMHIGASLPNIVGAETMKLLFDGHPPSALVPNKDGCTPLHLACLYKSPLDVLQVLLESNPDATCMTNNRGQTPLFVALTVGSTIDALRLLLKTRPDTVHTRDGSGTSPMALAWNMMLMGKRVYGSSPTEQQQQQQSNPQDENKDDAAEREEFNRGKANRLSLAVAKKSASLVGDVRIFMAKIDIMLRAAFHGTVEDPLPKNRQWRAVHAAASGGTCPPEVLAFALQILPGESEISNEDGDLPLHIACSAPPHAARCPPQLGTGPSIDLLLKLNNGGASRFDRKCRLPLHLALASRKTWGNGVRSLVNAFPEAVRMRDPKTKLFPFMTAACAGVDNNVAATKYNGGGALVDSPSTGSTAVAVERATVNTIFMLARMAPDLLYQPNGNAETHYLWRMRQELMVKNDELQRQLNNTEAELHKRMTAAELDEIAETKKKAEVRKREEECQDRNAAFERASGAFKTTMSQLETSVAKLRIVQP